MLMILCCINGLPNLTVCVSLKILSKHFSAFLLWVLYYSDPFLSISLGKIISITDFQSKAGRGCWSGAGSAGIHNTEEVYFTELALDTSSIRTTFLQQNSASGKMRKAKTRSKLKQIFSLFMFCKGYDFMSSHHISSHRVCVVWGSTGPRCYINSG